MMNREWKEREREKNRDEQKLWAEKKRREFRTDNLLWRSHVPPIHNTGLEAKQIIALQICSYKLPNLKKVLKLH